MIRFFVHCEGRSDTIRPETSEWAGEPSTAATGGRVGSMMSGSGVRAILSAAGAAEPRPYPLKLPIASCSVS